MKLRYCIFTAITLFAILGMSFSCSEGDDETDIHAKIMQEFVKEISAYAKKEKPGFIIIPQNGPELAFYNTEPNDGIMDSYVNAIDGIGIEELFYNGSLSIDSNRLSMLRTLKSSAKILVSDFVSDNEKIADSKTKNANEGFIAFPRGKDNYYYVEIPNLAEAEKNSDPVNTLDDAENYLYLINPDNFTDKTDMITKIKATNYDVILIDLFFSNGTSGGATELTQDDISKLKEKPNGAKRLVISYINIGSAENYRYYWKPGWKKGNPSWIKKEYEGYSDEYWVEFWDSEWRDIIYGNDKSYIKKIINTGFDGAYLDNVEAYYFLSKSR